MDFDLFELEDDDILSSVQIAPSECEATENPLPFFNCFGEDSAHTLFARNSFIRSSYLFSEKFHLQKEVELTDWNFNNNHLSSAYILDHLFNEARLLIQSLWADIEGLKEAKLPSYWERRRRVTILLHIIRSGKFHKSYVQSGLRLVRSMLSGVVNFDMLQRIYSANSIKGNETDTPSYHFLHGFLEWTLIDLLILSEGDFEATIEDIHDESACRNLSFKNQYFDILTKLLFLTIPVYKRTKLPVLLSTSPFPCTCIKEAWLFLQLLAEKVDARDFFWKCFNQAVDDMQKRPEKYALSMENIPEVIVFLLKGLVQLQGHRIDGSFEGTSSHRVVENYGPLEDLVNLFLKMNPAEQQLRVFVCILIPILLEWWPPKSNIPMLLWEYFYKKLNSAFFIAGSPLNNLAVSSSSGNGYLLKMKGLLGTHSIDLNHSSFTWFIVILGKTINKFVKSGHNNQVQKILGRIYSKFSTSKFLALNETGIHHLIELFLMLALNMESSDLVVKLRDKLLSIPLEKLTSNRQSCLMKGHLAMIILFAERSMDLSHYIKHLLEQISVIKNETTVVKLLAEGLGDIFEHAELFDRGEHLLIDTWLPSYLNTCTPVEQERLLEAFHNVLQKIKLNISRGVHSNTHSEIFAQTFSKHILPFVKQNFLTSFSPQIPNLAADFYIINECAPRSSSNDQLQKSLLFFIEANSINKQAVPQFLLGILSSNKAVLLDQSVIMKVWLKSLVLLSANNEDVMNLSKTVATLSDFKFISNLSPEEILSAKEPLCIFISSVGKTYSNCQDFNKKVTISNKFNSYLANFDKWIIDRNEKAEVSFRYYSFIAIVIFNCAQIVYSRNKSSCFFHIAMTKFFLPHTLQIGKAPEPKFTQMVHKVWPVIIQGIGTLNFKTDPYINKTLVDLIVRWTPHLKISQNPKVVAKPFLNALSIENEPLSAFIMEKLASSFLTTQRRQLEPHACLVITIFQEIINVNTTNDAQLIIFVKQTSIILLEHLMLVDEIVPSRNMILNLLRKIFDSPVYGSRKEIREILIETLKVMAVKHLAYYTFFYFDMLTSVANLKYDLVIEIKSFLESQIAIVEEKRGGGEDQSLRSCFQKFNSTLVKISTAL